MARITYKNKAGDKVPSVTTVLGVLDKPALKFWANKIGLEGIKMSEYVDDKAIIGTTAHYIVECYLTGEKEDFSKIPKVTPEQIEQARKCANKFFEWENCQAEFVPIANELQLVSENYQFGGTIDCVAVLNGKLTLIDFKTCNAIYNEPYFQTSAYKVNLEENFKVIQPILKEKGYNFDKIENVVILRIGRNEEEGFEYIEIPEHIQETSFSTFLKCLGLHHLVKNFTKQLKEHQTPKQLVNA